MDQAARRRLTEQMARLADGDREAFHPVFVVLCPLLRRFAAREIRGPEAEDASQEALLKVFARAVEFDRERDGLSWALGIAAYEIKTARRKQQRRREGPLDPEDLARRADPAPSPEEAAVAQNLDAVLNETLRELPPADEATLRAFASGESPEAVESATFRKRVERALTRLRRHWRAKMEGPGHDGR